MNDNRTFIEINATTVDEAVKKGLKELNLPDSAVEIEVLDAGSKGLLGLGSRQARVRMTVKSSFARPSASEEPSASASEAEPAIVSAAPSNGLLVGEKMNAETGAILTQEEKFALDLQPDLNDEGLLEVGRDVVQELLDRMKINALISARLSEPEDPKDKPPLLIDIHGDDLSILIGPKAETLNALQYIAGLIISKEVGRLVPLVVDVEGYRARRSQQIRSLARRMAEQAVRTGRQQTLEPMPANERRLVHIELRNHPDVTTQSIGEDPRRKVTINPK